MNHEDEIRLIAYRIWEEEGCLDGLHQEHWVRAETIWREEYMEKAASASPKAKARKPASPATGVSWLELRESKPKSPKPSAKKKRPRPLAKRSKR